MGNEKEQKQTKDKGKRPFPDGLYSGIDATRIENQLTNRSLNLLESHHDFDELKSKNRKRLNRQLKQITSPTSKQEVITDAVLTELISLDHQIKAQYHNALHNLNTANRTLNAINRYEDKLNWNEQIALYIAALFHDYGRPKGQPDKPKKFEKQSANEAVEFVTRHQPVDDIDTGVNIVRNAIEATAPQKKVSQDAPLTNRILQAADIMPYEYAYENVESLTNNRAHAGTIRWMQRTFDLINEGAYDCTKISEWIDGQRWFYNDYLTDKLPDKTKAGSPNWDKAREHYLAFVNKIDSILSSKSEENDFTLPYKFERLALQSIQRQFN